MNSVHQWTSLLHPTDVGPRYLTYYISLCNTALYRPILDFSVLNCISYRTWINLACNIAGNNAGNIAPPLSPMANFLLQVQDGLSCSLPAFKTFFQELNNNITWKCTRSNLSNILYSVNIVRNIVDYSAILLAILSAKLPAILNQVLPPAFHCTTLYYTSLHYTTFHCTV